MKHPRLSLFLLQIALPVLIGSAVYIFWRVPTLLVFHWIDAFGLGSIILWLREHSTPLMQVIPKWVLFSMPDGLWVYALTAFMTFLWHESDDNLRWLWICSGLWIGTGGELLQYLGIVPGTFDLQDLFTCLAGSGFAYFFVASIFVIGGRKHEG